MKIYVKAAKFKSSWYQRYDYTQIDAVIAELEKKLESTEITSGIDLEIEYWSGLTSSDTNYIINIRVAKDAVWTTPGGITVTDIRNSFIDVVSPTSFDSEFGKLSLSGIYSDKLPNRLLLIKVPYGQTTMYIYDQEIREYCDISIDDVPELLNSAIDKLNEIIDNGYQAEKDKLINSRRREQEHAQKRAEAMKSKTYNQPVSLSNIKKIFTAVRKVLNDSKLAVKGNYARLTSFEDDLVQYFDITKMVEEINADKDNLVFGDFMEDPWLIFDYGRIAYDGIHHAFESERYDDFKREMNEKYGFSR